MQVLDKISHSHPAYFKPLQTGKHSPSVEITFVFDELDKLATDIYSQQLKGNPDNNDSELHRLNLMKGLLSNMKRIITSSEARYIFLGGRLLHDDWLADGAKRQPLLTSIFCDEIYLPSLLTDTSIDWYRNANDSGIQPSGNIHLNNRIEEYLVWQFYLARIRFKDWSMRIWAPVIGLREWDVRQRGFIQASYLELNEKIKAPNFPTEIKTLLHSLTIRYTDNGEHLNRNEDEREYSRLKAFADFLAYRSAGNPKRLNELLASFVSTADRTVDSKAARNEGFNCQDVLYFPDHKVMRVQLIARVYKQLIKGFEEKIRDRDDKTIVALIYLSDFLFKFHQRAFSWENLELIDELIHMHRGHDLRTLLHELVQQYSDRYLHRIINGMYTYRFRSYFANELEYLSRHSEEEMAAFNFTLDEGQTLRDHLERQLEHGNRDNTDILNMLGELHEFYQEYETARQYYRRCIANRHQLFKEYLGEKLSNGDDEIALLQAIYGSEPSTGNALLAIQQWGPATLRTFLKIVMTYEREHNDSEAMIRCERCIKFAKSMIQAYATTKQDTPKYFGFRPQPPSDVHTGKSFYILEYLGLLFDPLFTQAWLLEKNPYTSSNSLSVLKRGLEDFDTVLNDGNYKIELDFVRSQWFKKTGALCFYKGLVETVSEYNASNSNNQHYVEIARVYYRKSAIAISRYFRKHIKTQFSNKKCNSISEALLKNRYPADYYLSVAECLGDISESIIATIKPNDLFKDSNYRIVEKQSNTFEQIAITLICQLDDYFFNSKSTRDDEACVLDWMVFQSEMGLSRFNDLNHQQQFDFAINLSFVSSLYLLRAGNLESAAREAMHTAEVIAQYLHWYWFDFATHGKTKHHSSVFFIIKQIKGKVIWYTHYINELFNDARSTVDCYKESKPYLMGDLIPSSALTSLCSIALNLIFFY
ncbi:hypothetical protein ACQE3E_08050 [Methylomonas sp. MED-D]|uniref:hypothetical protein n=1 Tax=Methylomonas sp. MED-D TaxID=3418768 RepID=UPI003D03FBA6